MIRISVLAAVMVVLMSAAGESAAATLQAPLLTSPGFASPVTIHWTPVQAGAASNDGGGGKPKATTKTSPRVNATSTATSRRVARAAGTGRGSNR